MRKQKKSLKKYGTRYHGRGYNDRNRGAGTRGGRGNAGSGKRGDQKKPSYIKAGRRFGKYGFKSINQRLSKKQVNAINIQQLEEFVDYYVEKGLFTKENDVIVADLGKLGIGKLLGKGLVKNKWNIIVDMVSNIAKKKIEEKGGTISK